MATRRSLSIVHLDHRNRNLMHRRLLRHPPIHSDSSNVSHSPYVIFGAVLVVAYSTRATGGWRRSNRIQRGSTCPTIKRLFVLEFERDSW
ncbi:hypothetical protein BD410DRAFT_585225 [Rickenella mellea]|uniref:Uncharacterized protein n=1 Tax=Rickenella mellea TaxID=50990 RepID=A0A4Y7PPE9_9AGAM|nr:hypothetical protein BD410DRAFT_585225 [Rickenella mellea]